MLTAALVPIVATALGTALGLGARQWHRVLEPVRSFALAAVTVTIVLHLMPEAVEEIGLHALVVLAAGLLLPTVLGWAADLVRGADGDHATVALELTFVGVLAHQVGDGIALAAIGDRWDGLLGIGAHTVPLAAVVAIAFAARAGRRAAIARAAVIAVTPIVGLVIVAAGAGGAAAAPWLHAAVSGLLLHVLAHDLPSAEGRTPAIRTAELIAIAAGAGLPLLAAADEHGHDMTAALTQVFTAAAPALVVGIVLGAAVHALARRARVRWLGGGGGLVAALRGAALGVPLPPCSCDVVPVARDLRERGGGPAFLGGFVLAAPEINLAAALLTVTFFGAPLALLRLAAAVAIAAVAGVVLERVARERGRHAAVHELPPGPRSFLHAVDDHVAHDGAWIGVGLTLFAFALIALAPGDLDGPIAWLVVALAVPVTISATAATPIAFALVLAGLSPGAALAAMLLGTMTTPRTLAFFARTWSAAAAAAAALAVVALAIALMLVVDAADLTPRPVDLPRPVELVATALLLGLAAHSLWRHGLAHWLAALRGSDHGHEHHHGAGEHHHH